MKILFTILLLAFATLAFGQTETPQVFGSRYYEFKNTVRMDSGLIAPRADTTQIRPSLLAPAFLLWRPQDQRLYIRDSVKFRSFAFYSELDVPHFVTIYDSLNVLRRSDQASIVRMSNGNLLMAWTAYTQGTEDGALAHIHGAESNDNGLSWHNYRVLVDNFDTVGTYIPSLYMKSDGTLIMNLLSQNSDTTSRFFSLTSNDNGGSWSTPVPIYSEPGKYFVVAADRIFKTSSGRLLYPIQRNVSGGLLSTSGVYEGKVLYSDNNGSTWDIFPYTIQSPDSLVGEAGIYQVKDTLIHYWRGRSGVVFAAKSTDDGATFSAAYSLRLMAPNSQSTLVYDSSHNVVIAVHNKYIGVINGSSARISLDLSKSFDNGKTWSRSFEIEHSSDSNYIEPTIFFLPGKDILISYSAGSNAVDTSYSLHSCIVTLNRVLYNSYPNGDPIINQKYTPQNADISIYGTIRTGAATIVSSNSTTQLELVRSELTTQGLRIRAGGAEAIYNSRNAATSVFADHVFQSTNNTTTAERMRLTGAGNLGIGTASPSSWLVTAGSFATAITAVTGNTTLNAGHHTVRVTATATITLPAASSCLGRVYCIINYNTGGNITTSAYLSFLAVSTTTVANGTAVWVQSDGTNWYQIK